MIKIIFITASILIFWGIKFIREKNNKKGLYKIPKAVLNSHKKISVSFKELELKTRGYYDSEKENNHQTKIEILDTLINKNEQCKIYREVSVVCYQGLRVKGKSVLLKSRPIYMPEIIISAKLKEQNLIDIYYDENNLESTYFDLSILALRLG